MVTREARAVIFSATCRLPHSRASRGSAGNKKCGEGDAGLVWRGRENGGIPICAVGAMLALVCTCRTPREHKLHSLTPSSLHNTCAKKECLHCVLAIDAAALA
eukprot:608571-Pleurochrysis_carterae.AAC.5